VSEVLFYQLREPPEKALPQLLEKTLQRGWRALVRIGSEERLQSLDQALWTYRNDSFLPHGRAADPRAALMPVILATDATRPNQAQVLFLIDGAEAPELDGGHDFDRIVLMFDGDDDAQLARAREDWKRARASGADATYWQQTEQSGWQKKA